MYWSRALTSAWRERCRSKRTMFVKTRMIAMAASTVTPPCQRFDVTGRASVSGVASARTLAHRRARGQAWLAHQDHVEVQQVGIGGTGDHEVSRAAQDGIRIALREAGLGVEASSAGPGRALPIHDGARRLCRSVAAVGARGEHDDIAEAVHGEGGGQSELLAAAAFAPAFDRHRRLAPRDHA